MSFLAGQYAVLTFAGLPPRSYSMANRPDNLRLEFHVRLVPAGVATPYVHRILAPGDDVEFYGPLGTSYLRDDHEGPVLAIAGGSGLGPIKSIIDTLVARPSPPRVHLYFGVRTQRDLYFSEHFEELARRGLLRYTPVLSEAAPSTSFRTGYLSDAIDADFQQLRGFTAYLAGPPIMVETCTKIATAKGLRSSDCHADAFS